MKMGVVYDLAKSSANDGFHIKTAGPFHYIVAVKDRNGGACMVGLSRMQAKFMATELLKHIEEAEKEQAEMEEDE